MKTLNDYMKMSYRMEIVEAQDEGGFVVSYPDLPGCITCGETIESAVANAVDAKKAWLEAALEEEIEISEPDGLEAYSGQFKLRVPRSLHRALLETLLVGILDTEHKGSVIVFCDQIRIQGSTQVSYMHPACRARCKSCFYIAHFSFLLISGFSGTILLSVPFHHLFRMENSPAFLPSCTILPLLPAAMLFFRPLRRAVSNIP